jgi:hypothetical protein
VAPPSRVFSYEWQGKDLRDTECVRVASKGLTKRHFCASVQRTSSRRDTPTPGVLQPFADGAPFEARGKLGKPLEARGKQESRHGE